MKKTLLITFTFLVTAVTFSQVNNGLVAYYPFNGDANDYSGNNNNGMLSGGVTSTTDRFGIQGNAYLFDGSTGYVIASSSASLESPGTTNAITQAAWINFTGPVLQGDGYCSVIMKSNQSGSQFMYRINVGLNNGGSITTSFNSFYNGHGIGYAFNLNTWYFIASTFNGTILKTYANGVLIDSFLFNTTIATDNLPLTIGADFPGATELFNGKIDDVRIYNRALSQAEINTLAMPQAIITDKSIIEGNSGTSIMTFKVTLDHASDTTITIKYKTADSTATAGSDYVATQGTLTFKPGKTSQNISVTINGDVMHESNERFKILLRKPVNVALQNSIAIGIIKNDDAALTAASTVTANNIIIKPKITISPNPSKDIIHISGLNNENALIEIKDLNGKIVIKQYLPLTNNIYIAKLLSGNYFVRIVSEGKTENLKFVKL